mmetsp:Transcript_21250/g.49918  ORF Transcript_21250/g.49918 Transcript_21250/m.49918 type:complete len:229 (+) Transcript_21250:1487-2173(+)
MGDLGVLVSQIQILLSQVDSLCALDHFGQLPLVLVYLTTGRNQRHPEVLVLIIHFAHLLLQRFRPCCVTIQFCARVPKMHGQLAELSFELCLSHIPTLDDLVQFRNRSLQVRNHLIRLGESRILFGALLHLFLKHLHSLSEALVLLDQLSKPSLHFGGQVPFSQTRLEPRFLKLMFFLQVINLNQCLVQTFLNLYSLLLLLLGLVLQLLSFEGVVLGQLAYLAEFFPS